MQMVLVVEARRDSPGSPKPVLTRQCQSILMVYAG